MDETHVLQHKILHSIQSHYLTIPVVDENSYFDVDGMTMYLGTLLWESPEGLEILRCKGLFEGFGAAPDAIRGEYML